MNCHYCGEPLSAFRMRADGDFCSAEHRQKYRRLARSGLARLAEADEAQQLVRRKDRPMELSAPVNGASAARPFAPPALSPGPPRLPATLSLEQPSAPGVAFLPPMPDSGTCDPAIFPPGAADFAAREPAPGDLAWAAPAPGIGFLRHAAPEPAGAGPRTASRPFEASMASPRFPEAPRAGAVCIPGAPRFSAAPPAAPSAAAARAAQVAFRLPPVVPEALTLPGIRPSAVR